jgi:hypothetical protein
MALFVLVELSEKNAWIRKVAENLKSQLIATDQYDHEILSNVWNPFIEVLVKVSSDTKRTTRRPRIKRSAFSTAGADTSLDKKSTILPPTISSASIKPESPSHVTSFRGRRITIRLPSLGLSFSEDNFAVEWPRTPSPAPNDDPSRQPSPDPRDPSRSSSRRSPIQSPMPSPLDEDPLVTYEEFLEWQTLQQQADQAEELLRMARRRQMEWHEALEQKRLEEGLPRQPLTRLYTLFGVDFAN